MLYTEENRIWCINFEGKYSCHEQFRIRCYGGMNIYLEKYKGWRGLCSKQAVRLNFERAQAIMDGDTAWMPLSGEPLICELYEKMTAGDLLPALVTDIPVAAVS